jgi:hypothetical protein
MPYSVSVCNTFPQFSFLLQILVVWTYVRYASKKDLGATFIKIHAGKYTEVPSNFMKTPSVYLDLFGLIEEGQTDRNMAKVIDI